MARRQFHKKMVQFVIIHRISHRQVTKGYDPARQSLDIDQSSHVQQ